MNKPGENSVRIACAQLDLTVEDPSRNSQEGDAAIRDAINRGARIIVLPELATSGYMFESEAEARSRSERTDGPTLTRWAALLEDSDAIVIAGFCELASDDNLYNSVALLTSSGVKHVYRKVHLWGDEKRSFQPGDRAPAVIRTPHGRIAVGICYDAYFPELARAVALSRAQLLVLPTNAPRNLPNEPPPPASFGDTPMQIQIWSSIAHVNGMFVAGCDRCGPERGVEWIGGSAIIDNNGVVLDKHPEDFGAKILIADCNLSEADNKVRGSRNNLLDDRRPDVYPTMGEGPAVTEIDLPD